MSRLVKSTQTSKDFQQKNARKRLMKEISNCDIDSKIQFGFQNTTVRLIICCTEHAGNKGF